MDKELTPTGLPVVGRDAMHDAFERMGDFFAAAQNTAVTASKDGGAFDAAIQHIRQENPVLADKINALIVTFQSEWEEKVARGEDFSSEDVNYANFGYLSIFILTYDALRRQAELNVINDTVGTTRG